MDISSLGPPGQDPFSPVPAPRDVEPVDDRAPEPDRQPAPLPPESGTVVDTSA